MTAIALYKLLEKC